MILRIAFLAMVSYDTFGRTKTPSRFDVTLISLIIAFASCNVNVKSKATDAVIKENLPN